MIYDTSIDPPPSAILDDDPGYDNVGASNQRNVGDGDTRAADR